MLNVLAVSVALKAALKRSLSIKSEIISSLFLAENFISSQNGYMKKISAGLLMYRIIKGKPEFFLVHPGGPYFKNKDAGAWSIPKGLLEKDEDPLKTAIREFEEETGIIPKGPYVSLGKVKQKSGKLVHAWAFQGECKDPSLIKSNLFEMEWPPRSGRKQNFPEIDKAEFFPSDIAKEKIISAQILFITQLEEYLENC